MATDNLSVAAVVYGKPTRHPMAVPRFTRQALFVGAAHAHFSQTLPEKRREQALQPLPKLCPMARNRTTQEGTERLVEFR
jgi:hypothetical protein